MTYIYVNAAQFLTNVTTNQNITTQHQSYITLHSSKYHHNITCYVIYSSSLAKSRECFIRTNPNVYMPSYFYRLVVKSSCWVEYGMFDLAQSGCRVDIAVSLFHCVSQWLWERLSVMGYMTSRYVVHDAVISTELNNGVAYIGVYEFVNEFVYNHISKCLSRVLDFCYWIMVQWYLCCLTEYKFCKATKQH